MRSVVAWSLAFAAGWGLSRLGQGTPAAIASGPPDFAAMAEAVEPGVVHVSTQVAGRSRDDAVGSGFVLTPDGLIVTSRHVLSGAQTILVGVLGREPVRAQVLGVDERVDVALLQVPLTGLQPAQIGSTQGVETGQWVLACGSPYGLPRSWSAGIVSGLHRRGVAPNPNTYEDFLQTDAAANLGNSGGPLLDVNGRVIGMVTQILTRAGGFQGISLATPIEAVMEAVQRLRGGRAAHATARPGLGVLVRDTPRGVEVTQVVAGSPAALAGIAPGHLLRAIAGQEVRAVTDVERLLSGLPPSDSVEVRVATLERLPDGRGGFKVETLQVRLR